MAKQSISQRQLDANGRNAERSTGPRTPRGKRRSSTNAVKHGIFARETVISTGDGKENLAEFDELLAGLQEYWKPAGQQEEMLLEEIATSYWRERRALRAERGQLTSQLDAVRPKRRAYRQERAEELIRRLPEASARAELMENPYGVELLIRALDSLRPGVKQRGQLTEKAREYLTTFFSDEESNLAASCLALAERTTQEREGAEGNPEQRNHVDPPEDLKIGILKLMDSERARLAELKKENARKEAAELEVEILAWSSPTAAAQETLLRYETTLQRKRCRAMAELLRLQKQRRARDASSEDE